MAGSNTVVIDGWHFEQNKAGALCCVNCFEVVVLPWQVDTEEAMEAVAMHKGHHELRDELRAFERQELEWQRQAAAEAAENEFTVSPMAAMLALIARDRGDVDELGIEIREYDE